MGELNHDLASIQNERERERERDTRMKGFIYSKNGKLNITSLGVYGTRLVL